VRGNYDEIASNFWLVAVVFLYCMCFVYAAGVACGLSPKSSKRLTQTR